MTESMIERVARALWDDRYPDKEWGDLERLSYTGHARAAIEAMREPTERMLTAGLAAEVRSHKTMQDVLDYDNEGGALEIVFPAMIDAALIYPAGSADRAGVPLARD